MRAATLFGAWIFGASLIGCFVSAVLPTAARAADEREAPRVYPSPMANLDDRHAEAIRKIIVSSEVTDQDLGDAEDYLRDVKAWADKVGADGAAEARETVTQAMWYRATMQEMYARVRFSIAVRQSKASLVAELLRRGFDDAAYGSALNWAGPGLNALISNLGPGDLGTLARVLSRVPMITHFDAASVDRLRAVLPRQSPEAAAFAARYPLVARVPCERAAAGGGVASIELNCADLKNSRQDAQRIQYYFLLGSAHAGNFFQGDAGARGRAISNLSDAISIAAQNPRSADHGKLYQLRGVLYLQNVRPGDRISWDLDKALTDFDAAISLEPGNPRSYMYRGFAHNQRLRPDAAWADFQKAKALDPSDPDIQSAWEKQSRIMTDGRAGTRR